MKQVVNTSLAIGNKHFISFCSESFPKTSFPPEEVLCRRFRQILKKIFLVDVGQSFVGKQEDNGTDISTSTTHALSSASVPTDVAAWLPVVGAAERGNSLVTATKVHYRRPMAASDADRRKLPVTCSTCDTPASHPQRSRPSPGGDEDRSF